MRRIAGILVVTACTVAASGLLAVPAASGGGACHRLVNVESGVTQVIADHACWNPVVAQVAVGTTLTFVNDGTLDHTLGGPGLIGSHDLRTGATVRLLFPEVGIFPYACMLHPQMAGAVVVGNPLAAAAPAAANPAAAPSAVPAAEPVALSSSDDSGSSLVDSTAVRVGSAAALASVLGAGFIGVRRRRAGEPRL